MNNFDEWTVICFKRAERDQLLQQSDKYLLSDYPISSSNLELIKQYRQDLRDYMDLPQIVNYNSNIAIPEIPKFPF